MQTVSDTMREDALLDFLYEAGDEIHQEVSATFSAWRNEHDKSLFLAYLVLRKAIAMGIVEVSPKYVRF